MKEISLLSIVVPAYKQEKTIIKNISALEKSLRKLQINYEIIIVIDGLVDKTYKKLKYLNKKNVKVFSYRKNIGKGYAVRYGMLEAKGDVRGFIDAGFDIDPTGISMLLNHMIWYDADIVVGSKLHPVSQVRYPLYRRVLSWVYRTFTRLIFGFKIKDTQVGVKLFKKQVVKKIFPKLLVKQFAFDVEILAVAYRYGYKRIYEAPVKLDFKGTSTITSGNFWKTIIHMLWDTMAVFYRLKIIRYYDKIKHS